MKVVFDTNLFVSAFIVPGSQGEQALLLAHRRKIHLFTSVPILTETARVLRQKFDQSENHITTALKIIGRTATIVRPVRKITVLEDVPDNRIVECAVMVEADPIVSGDQHLLMLQECEGISVVRLADFLRTVPSEE